MNLTPYQAAFVKNSIEEPVLYAGPLASGKTVALVTKAVEVCRSNPSTYSALIDGSGFSLAQTFQDVLRKLVPGYTSGDEVHFGNGSLLRIRSNFEQLRGYDLKFVGIDNAHYFKEFPLHDMMYRLKAQSGLLRLTATAPTAWIKENFLSGSYPYYLADEHNPYAKDILKDDMLKDMLDTAQFAQFFTLESWR